MQNNFDDAAEGGGGAESALGTLPGSARRHRAGGAQRIGEQQRRSSRCVKEDTRPEQSRGAPALKQLALRIRKRSTLASVPGRGLEPAPRTLSPR